MASKGSPTTVGSSQFDPDALMEKWSKSELKGPDSDDLRTAVQNGFNIPSADRYVYHAIASVTLAQVQEAINYGDASGMHAWYLDQSQKQIPPPSKQDIEAYTAVFSSTTSTTKALTALEKNAKKDSIRARVAANLIKNRTIPSHVTVPKLKSPHVNPYLDYWAWSCLNLEWAGPDTDTVNVRHSHHILPVFYHHFGCVCPSYESLEVIKQLAKGRPILDIGSGNGYWTYLLRRLGLTVTPIDNGDSLWRTMWVGDTIKTDGARFLKKENGAKDAVLLLVYPQVSTDFTISVLNAYKGTTICVAGTQNANGFTAFKEMTIDRYVAEKMSGFEKTLQSPLPSFAGKDEALFVFERKS